MIVMNHITYTTLRELHEFHCLTHCLHFKLVAWLSIVYGEWGRLYLQFFIQGFVDFIQF